MSHYTCPFLAQARVREVVHLLPMYAYTQDLASTPQGCLGCEAKTSTGHSEPPHDALYKLEN